MSPEDRSRNGPTRRRRAASSDRIVDWPQYLLANVPPDIRAAISAESADRLIAVSDVVREILCKRFRMHCAPVPYRFELGRDTGALNFLIRMPPKLHRAISRESDRTGNTMRKIILDILEAHYTKGDA